ncbi:MAG: hypothetical protein EOO40_10510, partial [Deltaproteobacteria bacterium]
MILAPAAMAQSQSTPQNPPASVDQAQAQQGTDAAAQTGTAADAASQQTQSSDIVVTGSRIARPEFA